MEYTVQALASLSGATARALRHYDQIGLLCPRREPENGYRLYGPAEVDRLQRILLYRALGMPLSEIQALLDAPESEALTQLRAHREALLNQRDRLDALLHNVDTTIRAKEGEITMTDKEKFEGLKKQAVEANEKRYGKEARSKYGDKAVAEANEKLLGLTEEEWNSKEDIEAQLLQTLAAALPENDPKGEKGQAVAKLHAQWLRLSWPNYNAEAHKALAQGYLLDERFIEYYDGKAGKGATQYLSDAVTHAL